ncbi:MAG TPA: hypothetical protein VJ577_15005 [Burkholderiaceae bacterium]|nr:hypothetical protein [Burkholderiaceae bacterium]
MSSQLGAAQPGAPLRVANAVPQYPKTKKARKRLARRAKFMTCGQYALAVFIMRPQADGQIGAIA